MSALLICLGMTNETNIVLVKNLLEAAYTLLSLDEHCAFSEAAKDFELC
jgi:hypothetical protein